jgi:hypothetical protein
VKPVDVILELLTAGAAGGGSDAVDTLNWLLGGENPAAL